MTDTLYLTGARLVLPDQIIDDGGLVVQDGHIASICPLQKPSGQPAGGLLGRMAELSLTGCWLMPGLIDLHTDAVESEVRPRPTGPLPADFAASQIDRRMALAGITTAYHALSFAGEELGLRGNEAAQEVVRALAAYRPFGLIDNRLHCRFEVTEEEALPMIMQLIDEGACHLVSLMDHTPGQGQFRDLETYRRYMLKRGQQSAEQIDRIVAEKLTRSAGTWERMQTLAEHVRAHNLPLASHDDDSPERIDAGKRLGVTISEFPMSLEVAKAADTAGMHTLVGSPNIFRGGSQLKQNVRGIDLLAAGHVRGLCSDYVPSTLVPAVFRICQELNWTLSQAINLVTAHPAQAVGLSDRGRLAVGLRADLLAVRQVGQFPQVVGTWSAGRMACRLMHPDSAD